MTRAQLIARIQTSTSQEKERIEEVVGQFFDTVIGTLENGEGAFIRNFGTFHLKKRNNTTGRDVRKNLLLTIPEHFIPLFRPAEEFKQQVKAAIKVV